MEVRSFQAPRWLGPILILIALALIPFLLTLALGLLALGIGASVIKALLPPSHPKNDHERIFAAHRQFGKKSDPSAIDAEYEVKDADKKA
jgi:hypothetical protein